MSELDGEDAEGLRVWHWGGTSWSAASTVDGRDDVYPDYNWVEVSGVTTFSPFTLSDRTGGPTAVALMEFASRSNTSLVGILILLAVIIVTTGAGFVLARRLRVRN